MQKSITITFEDRGQLLELRDFAQIIYNKYRPTAEDAGLEHLLDTIKFINEQVGASEDSHFSCYLTEAQRAQVKSEEECLQKVLQEEAEDKKVCEEYHRKLKVVG